MNNFKKSIAIVTVMCGIGYGSYAQVSATATATATIVTPISISNTADMNFGNIAVSATGGTVLLSPAGSRTPTGGVMLPVTATGTVTAASFTVSGIGTYTYAITLPVADVLLTEPTTSATMIVNAFTSDPSTTGTLGGTVANTGTQTLNVGATLNVSASQPAGVYVSAPFTVTVNYN